MSRIREVYPTSEIFHLYAAAQSNPDAPQFARNGSNIRFDRRDFYSYATCVASAHDVTPALARRWDREQYPDGVRTNWRRANDPGTMPRVLLMSAHRYSVTTAKQLNYLRHAWSGKILEVREVRPRSADDHARNITRYLDQIKENILAGARARSNAPYRFRRALELWQEGREYCAAFGLKVTAFPRTLEREIRDALADTNGKRAALRATVKKMDERESKARAAARVAREVERVAREAERAKENREAAREWLAGVANVHVAYPLTLLRREGTDVVTSRGARVPADVVPGLYARLKDPARRVSLLGRHVGPYIIGDVRGDVVRIGCHELSHAEIERYATAEGFASLPSLVDAETMAAHVAQWAEVAP